jgi:hypothetical protein
MNFLTAALAEDEVGHGYPSLLLIPSLPLCGEKANKITSAHPERVEGVLPLQSKIVSTSST